MNKLASAMSAGVLTLALLGLTSATPTVAKDEEKKPVWNDVTTGFALAKKENKPIITDFYTDWCGWCKVMEKKTFDDPEVVKVMAPNFVLVRANAEDGKAGEQLAKKYRLRGYPTIMFFGPDGQPKSTVVGFVKAPEFIKKLNDFMAGKDVSNE